MNASAFSMATAICPAARLRKSTSSGINGVSVVRPVDRIPRTRPRFTSGMPQSAFMPSANRWAVPRGANRSGKQATPCRANSRRAFGRNLNSIWNPVTRGPAIAKIQIQLVPKQPLRKMSKPLRTLERALAGSSAGRCLAPTPSFRCRPWRFARDIIGVR